MVMMQAQVGNVPPQQRSAVVDEVLTEARKLKAHEGARRLLVVDAHCESLTPETTYRWLDPEAFQHEVEEAMAHKVAIVHIIRNCWSVFPLILTWLALYVATDAYNNDHFKDDAGKSFLQLWQEGFHGAIQLTFSTAAIIDVILLGIFVGLIFLSSVLDNRAYSKSTKFAVKLERATQELVRRSNQSAISPNQSAITNVANAVQQVVNQAMQESRQLMQNAQMAVDQVVQAAQQSINTSNNSMQDLFNNMIKPMMVRFNSDMQTLHTELTNYQTRLNDLTTASQDLARASNFLMSQAGTYQQISNDINQNIARLNATQTNVLGQIQIIANGVTAAAGKMDATATNMGNATAAVQNVATQLDTGLRTTIGQMVAGVQTTADTMKDGMHVTVDVMTDRVNRATDGLAIVGPQLERAAYTLGIVTQNLASGRGIAATPAPPPPPQGLWQRWKKGGIKAVISGKP